MATKSRTLTLPALTADQAKAAADAAIALMNSGTPARSLVKQIVYVELHRAPAMPIVLTLVAEDEMAIADACGFARLLAQRNDAAGFWHALETGCSAFLAYLYEPGVAKVQAAGF